MEGRCGLAHYDELIIPDKLNPSLGSKTWPGQKQKSRSPIGSFTDIQTVPEMKSKASMETANLAKQKHRQLTMPKHKVTLS